MYWSQDKRYIQNKSDMKRGSCKQFFLKSAIKTLISFGRCKDHSNKIKKLYNNIKKYIYMLITLYIYLLTKKNYNAVITLIFNVWKFIFEFPCFWIFNFFETPCSQNKLYGPCKILLVMLYYPLRYSTCRTKGLVIYIEMRNIIENNDEIFEKSKKWHFIRMAKCIFQKYIEGFRVYFWKKFFRIPSEEKLVVKVTYL